mgnify:FL=1
MTEGTARPHERMESGRPWATERSRPMHKSRSHQQPSAFTLAWAAIMVALTHTACAQPTGSTADAHTSQRSTGENARAIETARDLLEAIERSDRSIRAIESGVSYTRVFGLAGDTQERRGRLVLENRTAEGELNRRFRIEFDQRIMGERRTEEVQRYIFDGRFLAEIIPADKQFTVRELARPGERYDPLSPSEGLFVVPVGQRTDRVLERFEAELRPADDQLDAFSSAVRQQAAALEPTQLMLTPKPGTRAADQFERIRIWYDTRDPGRVTPLYVRTFDRDGDETRVVFFDREIDPEITAETFGIELPPRDSSWNIHIERLPPLRDPDNDDDDTGDGDDPPAADPAPQPTPQRPTPDPTETP